MELTVDAVVMDVILDGGNDVSESLVKGSVCIESILIALQFDNMWFNLFENVCGLIEPTPSVSENFGADFEYCKDIKAVKVISVILVIIL